ncbi:ABC transporter ATP-binding protein [Candidatus Bipolaricaulota bacterium]|nr:ABC transporter ATP-binding protein [Candidatus Bipolaricaulota bacterium]TFH08944.1 MAG: ABC transporter ATP-binding protein [Candidatus Atribacteria bacterium]
MGETQVNALRGVSLELPVAQFSVIMGHSGSGKSTLMHLAGCLDVPTRGQVTYGGMDLTSLNSRERADFRSSDVGFVFQKYNLVSNLTAVENVALPLLLRNTTTKQAHAQAVEALNSVGLQDRMAHRPAKLSGGEQQRVAIARALVNDPTMILADEPTGNLDTATGDRILNLLSQFAGDDKMVLVVTHNPEIADMADLVIYLRDGQVESQQFQEVAR